MEGFSCQTHETADAVVVTVRGDVDLATRGRLTECVAAALEPGRHVVVDCAGITFMDSMGLSALVELRQLTNAIGSGFALAGVPACVARVLELSGTTAMFQTIEGPGNRHGHSYV